jgi:hypothetical protein
LFTFLLNTFLGINNLVFFSSFFLEFLGGYMYIAIINPAIDVGSAPNREESGKRWYFASQRIYLFKTGDPFPDKAEVNYCVSDNEAEARAIQPKPPGFYVLTDDAFYINRKNRLDCDYTKMRRLGSEEIKKMGIQPIPGCNFPE